MLDEVLDKSTPIPLYFQLKEIIKDKIDSGKLKPGDILPSERELSQVYQISRPTIRQALKELVNEGLLYREKGKGTYVSKPKINYGFIQKLTTFYDDIKEKGYQQKTRVLEMDVVNARKSIAKKLQLAKNAKLIYISRVRYVADEPVVTVENFIPYELCPNLINEDLNDKSLYQLLTEKYNLVAYRAQVILEPLLASEYDSKLLKIEEGAPIHLMQNVTYDRENVIIDYYESRFRGDKGQIKVELYK